MSLISSEPVQLGAKAAGFSLKNTNPNTGNDVVCLSDFSQAHALLIAFICNHCPYVVHLRDAFCEYVNDYKEAGLEAVAICSNDAMAYPQDGPEAMREYCQRYHYPFVYLHDETQSVAKSYSAQCTPDFFLFDKKPCAGLQRAI